MKMKSTLELYAGSHMADSLGPVGNPIHKITRDDGGTRNRTIKVFRPSGWEKTTTYKNPGIPKLPKLRKLEGGGAGSGCHGPNCGRPGSQEGHVPSSSTMPAKRVEDESWTNRNGATIGTGKHVRLYSPAGDKAEVIGHIRQAKSITVMHRDGSVQTHHEDAAYPV